MSSLVNNDQYIAGNEPTYSKRGLITIRSLKAGIAEFVDEEGISPEERDLLKVVKQPNGHNNINLCLSPRTSSQWDPEA